MRERPPGTIPAGNGSAGGFVNRAVTDCSFERMLFEMLFWTLDFLFKPLKPVMGAISLRLHTMITDFGRPKFTSLN